MIQNIFLKLIGLQIAWADVDGTGLRPTKSLKEIFDNLINYAVRFSYLIAAGMIVFGGYQILFAGASEDNFKNGRKTITYAIVGIIVITLARSIIALVQTIIF